MLLKESFRMQNHLNDLAHEAMLFLSRAENVMKIRKDHQKSKSNPEAADEIQVISNMEMDANLVIELYLDFLAEKARLGAAISRAKASADFDMDAAIAMNKIRQEAIGRFLLLANLKSKEYEEEGKGYLINAEGNQSSYVYPVRVVHTINHDRTMVKGIQRRLQREFDEAAAKVDLLKVTLEVDFEPKYEIGESFEDVYEKFERMKKSG